jgi:site-specific DNA-methyltransferase (adenine-specific)
MVPSDEYRAKLEVLFGYPSDKRDIVGSSVDRRGDGTLYKVGMSGTLRGAGDTDAAKQWSGYGTTTKPAYEPLVVTRKPLDGTVANNVLKHGTGALNIDGARVGTGDNLNGGAYAKEGTARHDGDENWRFKRDGGAGEYVQPSGRFPANLALVHDEGCERVGAETVDEWQCTDTCAVAELSRQSTGTAARFFYQGKATARDRLAYLTCSPACPAHGTVAPATTAPSKGSPCPRCGKPVEVYQHPTVKPYELALYHAKLLSLPPHTRPVALVPFCGTGVEARALMDVGYRVIAVDLDPRHCAMTSYRLGGEQPAREARVEPETTAPPAPLTLDDLLGF